MRKEYLALLAAGCVVTNAANVNYDLLGRKESKMNSPMVYKNVDYSKVKKGEEQKVGSSLENASLKRTGLDNGLAAIEGIYNPRSTSSKKFTFTRYYPNVSPSPDGCDPCDWSEYKGVMNSSVNDDLKIVEVVTPLPSSTYPAPFELYNGANFPDGGYTYASFMHGDGWTLMDASPTYYSYSESPTWGIEPHRENQNLYKSDYESGNDNLYVNFYDVKTNLSYEPTQLSEWYDSKSTNVGVYMSAQTYPVMLGAGKFAGFVKNLRPSWTNDREPNELQPGYEIRESRTHSLIKWASTHPYSASTAPETWQRFISRTLINVGKGDPAWLTNSGCNLETTQGCLPQVYIGVRNSDIKAATGYNDAARALDNFVYNHRTIEFVPSGNYIKHSGYGNPKMFERAFSANAITVGAVDMNWKTANYTSNASNAYGAYLGTQKPEIFNFSRVIDPLDAAKVYKNRHSSWSKTYQPYYDGTEVSAAFTAGMVSNLLAINPFYRWHPEVVKAVLLTSFGFPINPPYVDHQVMTTTPSYKYLVFDDAKAKNLGVYSRYWNGSFDKVKTSELGDNKIFFTVNNSNRKGKAFKAAIAWLNKGSDIGADGKIPQSFVLHVYGKNNGCPTIYGPNAMGTHIASSEENYNNSFAKVDVGAAGANYSCLGFIIERKRDESSDAGQVVLGFNLATEE
jgi:hypothetical protein